MPTFEYSPWDGSQNFTPLSAESAFDKLSEYLLEHGEYILRQLERADENDSDILKLLIKEGFLEEDPEGGLAVSARGVKRIEERALDELFLISKKDTLGKHTTDFKGAGSVRHEDSKPYEYGDPVANLNLHETLKNALVRQGAETPLHVTEDDFVVYETEYQTSCATVLLLDMSGSMARYGKYYHAKKVALALQGLVRGRYSEDSLKTIGFYTYASPLTEKQLLRSAPKPVSIYDSRVFLRVSLDNPPEFVPEHFTNIQAGLKFARQHLRRQAAANKQIICITDGEPTAHLEGRELLLVYPPSERTARNTLQEVRACTAAGIKISTFALIEDYYYTGLVNFVDQMARASKGLAVYCTAGELGSYVLDSFVTGRAKPQEREALSMSVEVDEDVMVITRRAPREKTERKKQPPYHVILHNDDDHSFGYVIGMLQQLFGHPVEKGFMMAQEVHTKGRVIVDTTSKERAELKRDQIHGFGADKDIPRCKGSMSASIEPAE